MPWTVLFTGKAKKQKDALPSRIRDALDALRRDLEVNGPAAPSWPHYGKLRGRPGWRHCHLNKGKPRYVAVWIESEGQVRVMEVRYVGSHEKADYGKIR